MSDPEADQTTVHKRDNEQDVSVLDLMLVVARKRDLILRLTIGAMFIGLLYSIFAPIEFKTQTRFVKAQTSSSTGGIASQGISALQGLGFSLGGLGETTGLTPQAYPEVIKSQPVRIAVARDTFYFPAYGERMTFVDFHEREQGIVIEIVKAVQKYTVGLPGMLLNREPSTSTTRESVHVALSEIERDAITRLAEMSSVQTDDLSGIVSLEVSAPHPVLSAEINDRIREEFTRQIQRIRTQKARENLTFVEQELENARIDLQQSEESLAAFTDRNQNISTARLQTERERLQRQVRFASNVFENLQAQVTQARLELKRSEPVVTVLEPPIPPNERSAPKRKLIVILSIMIGLGLSIVSAFVSYFFEETPASQDEQARIQEVRNALIPRFIRTRYFSDIDDAEAADPNHNDARQGGEAKVGS